LLAFYLSFADFIQPYQSIPDNFLITIFPKVYPADKAEEFLENSTPVKTHRLLYFFEVEVNRLVWAFLRLKGNCLGMVESFCVDLNLGEVFAQSPENIELNGFSLDEKRLGLAEETQDL
jgi:hypothetical protein